MNLTSRDLPIWKLHDDLQKTWQSHSSLVLTAPTGSGKTTQVCQMLLDSGRIGDRQIVVLQPRRVAARSVAARVAFEKGVVLGDEVGYQIRFEDRISEKTRIRFMTEGVLLRLFLEDPQLPSIGAILFDEFHERNLFSDIALGLAKKLQQTRRPDLLLVIMSATLEAESASQFIGNCPILKSEGRSFPVEIRYLENADSRRVSELAAEQVDQILKSHSPGDILVFMPGMFEIQETVRMIQSLDIEEKFLVMPLHGDLPIEAQDAVFQTVSQRKIIVSTNVAETSVTIDGVRFVIDSGLARVSRYDPSTGISTLRLETISKASAQQRSGRAGRTASGECFRLWTEKDHEGRSEQLAPEILRTDLASMVLLLHSLGIDDPCGFELPDQPDVEAVREAEEMLERLGALSRGKVSEESDQREDEDASKSWSVTSMGHEMLRLPVHPRYGRMLVEANRRGCIKPVALFAALTSGRDLLMRTRDREVRKARELFEGNSKSDFFTLSRAYLYAQQKGFSMDWGRKTGIHIQTARMVELTFSQLLDLCRGRGYDVEKKPLSDDEILKCVLAGFADHLAVRKDFGTLDCTLLGGRTGSLARESVVTQSRILVSAEIRKIDGGNRDGLTLLNLATAVETGWLREIFPDQISEKRRISYDWVEREVVAVLEIWFRDLLLESRSADLIEPPREVAKVLAEILVNEPEKLPMWNHEVKQWIARVRLVAQKLPQLNVQRFSRDEWQECLTRVFDGASSYKEVKDRELLSHFTEFIPEDQREEIDLHAPKEIKSPGGKSFRLLYHPENGQPSCKLSVPEAMEWPQHPVICQGKVRVTFQVQLADRKSSLLVDDIEKFKARLKT